MKPKIIEVKDFVSEQRKPPEGIVFSYDPTIKTQEITTKKSFLSGIRSFLRF